MLDRGLIAECIGLVKQRPSITASMVADELEIDVLKATEILFQLEDCCLIVYFGGFFACTDLIDLN